MEPSFLLIARADSSATVYPLSKKRNVIGRQPKVDIFIDHFAVSRHHAVIERGPSGRWWILDLDSTNGTFVNGTKVKERLLSRRDIVRIGDCTLTLRLPSSTSIPCPIRVSVETHNDNAEPIASEPSAIDSMLTMTSLQPYRSEPLCSAPTNANPIASAAVARGICAEQLSSIMNLSSSLQRLEEPVTRLSALCDFVVGDTCRALAAVAIRIDCSGKYVLLCEASTCHPECAKFEFNQSLVTDFLNRREPVMTHVQTYSGSTDPDNVRMLIPFAELDSSVLALHVCLPAHYDTAEWLTLVTLVAGAYHQSELVWEMRHQVRQNAFVERDLEMAYQIQSGLVPKQFFAPGLSLAFGFEPCRWVGGDYVDALKLADGRVLLGIADVCGKGLQAALVASSVHTFVHASQELGQNLPLLVKRLNEYLLGYLPEHSFVTMLCILLDPRTGSMELVNAGHPSAIIVRNGGVIDVLTQMDNVSLGVVPSDFRAQKGTLNPGDVLLMYTDGLTEMVDVNGEPFGMERLANEFQRIVAETPLAAVDCIRRRTLELCDDYRGPHPASDDRTFLVAKRQ